MPLLILSIIIQVAFVIHIVKTGRNTTWIWIVLMLPMAGAIAYLIIEVLPDILNSKSGRKAGRKAQSLVTPHKNFNEAVKQYSQSDTSENSIKLAEECLDKGLYTEAKSLYQKCLSGLYKDDPSLMFGLARCDFEIGNYPDVKITLDKLIELNPEYKNQDAHLLYARTLEKLGETSPALHEYETLHNYYIGPEASYYYAKFLQYQGQHQKSRLLFEEIVSKAKNANKHYNSLHKDIIKQAKQELNG